MVSVSIEWQKAETPYQTKESLQCTFASKEVWTKGYTVGHTVTHYSFHDEIFFSLLGKVARVNAGMGGGED